MNIKKGYWITLLIIAVLIILGIASAQQEDNLVKVYTDKPALLVNHDFIIDTPAGQLEVGKTSFAAAKELFPAGQMLGMSTIYSLDPVEVLLTFTEEEDILYRLHISSNEFITSRGIKVGDPFTKVKDLYGAEYDQVFARGHQNDFDAVYGSDNSRAIIFQVRNGAVQKIVLQKDPAIRQ